MYTVQPSSYPALVVKTHALVVLESNKVCTFWTPLEIILSPWLIFQWTIFRSSQPPVFCCSSKFERCKHYSHSIFVHKGIINFLFWRSKLKKYSNASSAPVASTRSVLLVAIDVSNNSFTLAIKFSTTPKLACSQQGVASFIGSDCLFL